MNRMSSEERSSVEFNVIMVLIFVIVIVFFGYLIYDTGKKAGNATNSQNGNGVTYEQQAKVAAENMIKSYNSDKELYDSYKNSAAANENDFATQAKLRANTTATTYNEYMIKYSYVWNDNLPDGISPKLEIIN